MEEQPVLEVPQATNLSHCPLAFIGFASCHDHSVLWGLYKQALHSPASQTTIRTSDENYTRSSSSHYKRMAFAQHWPYLQWPFDEFAEDRKLAYFSKLYWLC
jgi:hypothetical protein